MWAVVAGLDYSCIVKFTRYFIMRATGVISRYWRIYIKLITFGDNQKQLKFQPMHVIYL